MFKRIYIEITNVCNLNCSFCMKNNRDKKQLSRPEFNHILNQVKGLSEHIYLHVQGEPFMHPELISFLDDCQRNNLKVHLVTNGTLLSKVSQELYTHPALVQLSISIHSAQMKINDSNYVVLKNLISITENSKFSLFLRLWSKNDKNLIHLIHSLIDNSNLDIIDKRTRIKKNLFIDVDQEFTWPSLDLPTLSDSGTCHAGKIMLTILSNGEITPCCLDANGILSIGNIFEESLSDCLNKTRFQDLINGFKKRQCVESLCQKCTYKLRFNK